MSDENVEKNVGQRGDLTSLPVRDGETGLLNVIVEAPKGTGHKWKYDPALRLFRLGKILPSGATFPFDFGFLPSTLAEDGDPLDILVVTDLPAITGGLLSVRLLGVIEAEQTAEGKTIRNDRLVGVVETKYNNPSYEDIFGLDRAYLDDVAHFFVSYNEAEGREFKPLKRAGIIEAEALIEQAERRYQELRSGARPD